LHVRVLAMAHEITLSSPAPRDSGWQPRCDYHYTVTELSEAWNVSPDFIRDMFRDERDVVRWVRSRPGKRRYVVVRIPAIVAERVYRRAQRV
jgi:hypothetical protein